MMQQSKSALIVRQIMGKRDSLIGRGSGEGGQQESPFSYENHFLASKKIYLTGLAKIKNLNPMNLG
jgi:hypothetical protein